MGLTSADGTLSGFEFCVAGEAALKLKLVSRGSTLWSGCLGNTNSVTAWQRGSVFPVAARLTTLGGTKKMPGHELLGVHG